MPSPFVQQVGGAAASPWAPPAPAQPPAWNPAGYPPSGPPAGGIYAPPTYAAPGWVGETVTRPTEWTEPLQIGTAAWLVVAALSGIFVTLSNRDALMDQVRQNVASNSTNATQAQLDLATNIVVVFVFGIPIAISVLMILLAAAAYARRSAWSFYTAMVVVALGALGGLFGLISLATNPDGPNNVGNRLAINGFIGGLGALLLIFMAIAVSRHGPWAARKVPVPSA